MNRFQDLPAADLELLKDHMRAGRYYLLLGSGVSLDTTGDQRPMRSANQLRLDLAKMDTRKNWVVDCASTATVGQYQRLVGLSARI